jgi:Fe-S cluster biogenesis protein NfuA
LSAPKARTIIVRAPRHPGSHERSRHVLTQVEEVIEIIRPAIQADGGDISLVEVDDESGVVTVELHGACVSCPASTVTMKAGIERIMKDRIPGVNAVIQKGDEIEYGTAVSL